MAKKEPNVSVNLTTFNRAILLKRAIQSVQKQSVKDLEIIVVDDCSSDNTKAIVEQLIQKDKRVVYLRHNKNSGNAVARNTALANSKGEYIAFLDDDDEWIDKDKLKKQLNVFKNSNEKLAFVSTGVNIIDSKGKKRKLIPKKPKDLKRHILKRNGIIYSPTVLTKKTVLEKVGGFDENMKRGVDSEFYRTCIVRHNYDIKILPDVTTRIIEYSDFRITSTDSFRSVVHVVQANFYLIWKYKRYVFSYPSFVLFRLKTVGFQVLRYISNMVFRNTDK